MEHIADRSAVRFNYARLSHQHILFWEVTDAEVKTNFRFYQFLEKYCERFGENNHDFDTKGHGNFQAVIDGQQRLTSLYIGLKGT